MPRMFLWCSHGSMSRRGSLPLTGPWLQRLRSHHGFTLAKQREGVSAFTLVELLIATGITVAMVLMLGLMLGSLMGSASHTTARVDAFRDARAALQMIERDLRNLVRTQWNPDPFTSPTPTPGTVQPLTRPLAYFALKNIYDPTAANQEIYGVISAKNSGSGDVCFVGYYCSWDGRAYSLRRFFRDSAAAYTVLSSPSPMPSPSTYIADSDLYKPNPSPSPSPADDVLAQYVWNLRITAYDVSGNALSYPRVCDQAAAPPIGAAPIMPPAALEISFNAMSPQAARAVMSVTSDPSVWMNMDPNLVKPHAYEFRSRINLP
jgi:type II secretory pathway pseudopilin PulG